MIIIASPVGIFDFIKQALRSGKVICFPTETVYALACDARNTEAVERIKLMKERSDDKPLSVLVKDFTQIKRVATVSKFAATLIKKFSPGPITYVLPALPGARLADSVLGNQTAKNQILNNQSIGIRIPDHPVALYILNKYYHPLVATSVNLAGAKPANSLQEILDCGVEPDVLIEGKAMGEAMGRTRDNGIASTVVDLTVDGQYKVLRPGVVSEQSIRKAVEGEGR